MNADTESGYAAWSRNMFQTLRIGGIWGVPRTGLIFTRTGENDLALTAVMPHEDEMPITPEMLVSLQREDYEQIKHYMEMAGITVTDQT